MAAPAQTRRVVQYARHGDSSVLQVVDAPVPPRKKGQVAVDVRAAGVNPVDYKMRDGFGALSKLAVRLPHIPGGDVAGVVAEADEGSQYKPGERRRREASQPCDALPLGLAQGRAGSLARRHRRCC